MDEVVIGTTPRWNAVFLVCKACGKRSHAPKDLKPKKLISTLRGLSKAQRPRPRILLTGCLGLCPKRAMAVASVGGDAPTRIVAVESMRQLESWAALPTVTIPLETPRSDDH